MGLLASCMADQKGSVVHSFLTDFSHVEKNRFKTMKDFIQRLRAPQQAMPVQKSMESFHLLYTYPHCPEPRDIRDMDPAQNTVEDLMLRICHQEAIGNSKAVCLYTVEGMPLTDDPFFNTWSLKDRHIENGSELYAIFTPKENLKQAPQMPQREMTDISGEENVRCHIMLKGDYEVKVNLASDTIRVLRQKLSNESGIPAHVLLYKGECNETLQECGINEETTVPFSLSSFADENPDNMEFYMNDVVPSVQQTRKGLSAFFSSLYTIKEKHSGEGFKKVNAYIRKLSGCNPLAQSLYQLLCRNESGSRTQKIAIVEGLYTLFRELLPSLNKKRGDKIIEDPDVFENAPVCWAYLISKAEKESSQHEIFAPICLTSQPGVRFCDPVQVPGLPDVFEREYVLQKIKDGEKIPNCSAEILRETSMWRATDVEKILLSLPPSIKTFPVWVSYGLVTGQNFQIKLDETFAKMTEELKAYPHLIVTPPLQLKDIGVDGPRLVLLKEDNLGVYIEKAKGSPLDLVVFDCLAGKHKTLNVDELAHEMRDTRSDQTFMTTRTPKEAILEHIHNLIANGCTVLYDALNHGISELEKVGKKFPDCRLRIICLTDGNDFGSKTKPHDVTTKLMCFNIIVDAIIVGKVDNHMLHGISNATGGCCFKPETGTAGLKLFEMETVLSLEMRKPKEKMNPSSITSESVLTTLFTKNGYDEQPEVSLPSELNSKVTVTENSLKKNIKESKSSRFLEKDKRILEELKSLHCDPHPFCTVLPLESDFTFWKILMQGPPDTPYENGAFELYCQFGAEYPVKPPLVRFVTPVYHCNVNSVGRICHNIFDRNYSAHITMREILDAVYGLLILPEPEDPLDSILAEEFLTSREKYEQEAKKNTEETAGNSMDDMEQKLVGEELTKKFTPSHLVCSLTKKMFIDPVKNQDGTVYERKAIEKHLKMQRTDPKTKKLLRRTDLKSDTTMQKMVREHRKKEYLETSV
uniref:UBC core domain-containing protein n=1 Tax=Hucho hucho TaxID=62062 RepID=A0A4W5S1H4_9TELE